MSPWSNLKCMQKFPFTVVSAAQVQHSTWAHYDSTTTLSPKCCWHLMLSRRTVRPMKSTLSLKLWRWVVVWRLVRSRARLTPRFGTVPRASLYWTTSTSFLYSVKSKFVWSHLSNLIKPDNGGSWSSSGGKCGNDRPVSLNITLTIQSKITVTCKKACKTSPTSLCVENHEILLL